MPAAIQHQKPVIFRKGDIEEMYRELSRRLDAIRNEQTTNIIHGGAVFVGYFQARQTTEDIDYFYRHLEHRYGIALVRQLQWIIDQISVDRSLSTHWMNSDGESTGTSTWYRRCSKGHFSTRSF